MELSGKVAFVTGGSGDIGGAIAHALAAGGADVAISYIGADDRAAVAVAGIRNAGRRSTAVSLDQRQPSSIDAAVAAVIKEFGRLDILVNNAAWNIGIPFADLDALTPEIWDRVMETDLRGPFLLARASARHLRANGAGRIVNIASLAGIYPAGSSIAYAAAKAGLIHLTRCLAVSLAPAVTVNSIAPGLVPGTRMSQNLPDEVVQAVRKQVVLGRTATAQDIATQAVTFCRADSVTGQVLVIDGGLPGGMH